MQKFRQTGLLPQVVGSPLYGDFSSSSDFLSAKLRVQEAENEFLKIPSEIRKRFDNDPGAMMDWLADPDNALEAADMGLIELEAPGDPTPPPVPPEEPQPTADPPKKPEKADASG